ncbi:MAG: FAD-dependent monooxygenase [Pseudotabrizicola sp.]|uniref:FAD-dependent monooxygenase n=1 Tax=Pseudotabrizicola sp. TaxID=2939647 RepID=UPI002727497C|nr:FAD-dependent monooxygenase [Pseudotabrizicola sp.]MDO8882952.1 FAD-dependent monooxygenase [Pseudotabrizicola sp.]MDP2079751.1 FAD-dependent monooxygenase [Pseudotabrizicola sp.]MDZ7574752.1 FAD-dependent monooxygenase [Pseudotabrizicola sp.]
MSLIGQNVTVLGAGVAGLAVARALALRGAQVTVLEQADAVREVGAGLQISPNGAAVLRALGLEEALVAVATRAQAVELRDGLSGDVVTRLDVAGAGYHFAHRADLIALLLDGAREAGVDLRLLQKIDSVDLSGARPAWRNVQGGTGETGLLIGADGLHSKVRLALTGKVAPFFTHQVAWRAMIPESPGVPNVAEVHMAAGQHLVSYPLRGGTMRNIVAVEERRSWVEEGWTLRDDTMDMKLAFAGFSPRVRAWLDQVEDVWLWGLFRHPVARDWFRVQDQGAAVILGDAAHPTLPFLAQGACMALEDAWVLADCLASHDSVAAGLAAYQATRLPRCSRIVAAANTNARLYHLSGVARGVAHLGLRMGSVVAPGAAIKRFDWLYKHDVTAG